MRCPCPKHLDTPRQRAAYLFAFEYVRIGSEYGHSPWADFRVQRERRNYIAEVAREVREKWANVRRGAA